jgi:hypothetical protein
MGYDFRTGSLHPSPGGPLPLARLEIEPPVTRLDTTALFMNYPCRPA